MTDLVVRNDQQLDLATTSDQAIERLAEWARVADAAYGIATKLCGTTFAPKAYRGKPEEATAAILAGAELGLGPMAALRAFDDIQGTPAPKAITLRAIVQSRGHALEVIEADATHCIVEGKRRDSERWQRLEWTIERATTAGYVAKNPKWKTDPKAQLVARATAEMARWLDSAAIMGMPYSSEELGDEPAAVRPRLTRVTAAEILGQPADADDVPVTGEQLRTLGGLFRAKGITSADEGLTFVGDVAGRFIGATADLTTIEADRVIARLRELPDEQPDTDEDWPAPAEIGGAQ
ncbi:hypothetical protein [Micromonospora aurantiaca]|uniref:Uncharacterized protein n=1 Tax=Micromonospora aurantiaca (nom. illeg.) TaxID=47850 RepID=A0A6N3JUJ0_9ACTN|nr:hypothetical protein [Micromonospora aurantiaca]AXH89435.1 hypothetical protein DVH21_05495 [Micromonospora aurantiaca]